MSMRVLIIEDENAAAIRLKKMLEEVKPGVEVVEIIDSVESGIAWLQQNPAPDLILADIHLADGPSFEIFKKLPPRSPVIFTTAFDQYALQAFKFNGIDYLLKPIKKQELEASLQKFSRFQTQASPSIDYNSLLHAIQGKPKEFQKRIVIRFGQTIRTVEIDEVAYFYTEEKITFACTKDGKKWPLDFTLDELEDILNPKDFFRINRQFIIHIKSIDTMQSYSKSRIKIELKPSSDIETIVSAERSADFKNWLTGA